ncbi:hypothetical protein EVAR_56825_1 [Eumeta japonica]|uniref:Uncharacterized protein n=1 Tax=Eumeta variegata TaxID=151549 RepID=A0A4C1ZEP9_EUMVA|nr:hypothetical protein EVAR_56825_1 [Eumeta japonica]
MTEFSLISWRLILREKADTQGIPYGVKYHKSFDSTHRESFRCCGSLGAVEVISYIIQPLDLDVWHGSRGTYTLHFLLTTSRANDDAFAPIFELYNRCLVQPWKLQQLRYSIRTA